MDTFLADAASILEAAEAAAAQNESTDWTILLKSDGGIHMVAASDWALDALAREHLASSAFRVQHHASRVTVEGHTGGRSCRLATTSGPQAARILLGFQP